MALFAEMCTAPPICQSSAPTGGRCSPGNGKPSRETVQQAAPPPASASLTALSQGPDTGLGAGHRAGPPETSPFAVFTRVKTER